MEKLKKLPKEELINLALIKSKVEVAESKLETAQAQFDLSVNNFKLNLLHMFNRLGLSSDCKITDDGSIIYPDQLPPPLEDSEKT